MLERDELTYIKNILNVSNTKNIDFSLLENVFTLFEHEPKRKDDVFDSFSRNQYIAKRAIVNHLEDLNLLNLRTEVVIWGSWYGSILVPLLQDKVKKITCVDEDETVITLGDNRLFPTFSNVEWITGDIFKDYKECYNTADIFINTSCEHMLPMKWWGPKGPRSSHNYFLEWDGDYRREWKGVDENKWPVYDIAWWDRVKPTAHFAFTSNNMHDIEGHINCVNSIKEFKEQLPPGAKVLREGDIEDERGIRYILIGKI